MNSKLLRYPSKRFRRDLGTFAAHCALLPAVILIGYAFGRILAVLVYVNQ